LTADAQTVQSGTAEKVGIFIQSISYFIVAFIVGFVLNARLTGILFAAVIPSMALVIIIGTSVLNRFSKQVSECTSSAASIAEGAIKAVQVVQAFDAFESLTTAHQNHLTRAMRMGVKKAIAGAVLLGSVFFIAYVKTSIYLCHILISIGTLQIR
jgi:ATP-binding cassette subfamily B (MDR/TAP) protein 1